MNESDFLLCEGRSENSTFYEGQVWRELGDRNYEIKLTSMFEGFTNIYLNSPPFDTCIEYRSNRLRYICGTLYYTCQ